MAFYGNLLLGCWGLGTFTGVMIFFGVFFVLTSLWCIKSVISDNNKAAAAYESKKRKYETDLRKYEKDISKYNKSYDKIENSYREFQNNAANCISEIDSEKSEISEQLQKAYDANIIPLQFRNIQGIYYLYDYISTSNQGLSEALMQCNLEAIKARLDNVINLQGKAIVQQAQANAALYQQNQQILITAQATMNNTAIAAKYAAISATNSTLALKLQKKNLAYQRADFWLK